MKAIESGADVRCYPQNTDSSFLHIACTKGHAGIVSALLSRNADPNSAGNRNGSPLQYAAEKRVMQKYVYFCWMLMQM
jgi:ankyrin repeat protein